MSTLNNSDNQEDLLNRPKYIDIKEMTTIYKINMFAGNKTNIVT